MLEKTCRTCRNILPATMSFFYESSSNKGGLTHQCKECTKKYSRDRHAKIQATKPIKKKLLDPSSLSKVCPGCGVEKNKEQGFWKNKASRDGYASRCKNCSKDATQKWRHSEIGRAKTRSHQEQWRANNPSKVRASKKRYRQENLEQVKAAIQKCWEENREEYKLSHWRYWLKKKYGLTEDRFYELMREQNYRCAICGRLEKDSRKQKFCVDHCHDTGVVRGLLCFGCNTMLGNANDSIEIMEAAIAYIKRFPKNIAPKEETVVKYLQQKENTDGNDLQRIE